MTTYCNVSQPNLNNNIDLDNMARNINNKRKNLERGIKAFNTLQNIKNDKYLNINKSKNFYHAYDSGADITPSFKSDSDEKISLDTPTESISDDISSISWEPDKIDEEIKVRTNFKENKKSKRHKCTDFDLKSVDSLESIESGDSLLRHIRFCLECKDKIIKLIKEDRLCDKTKKYEIITDNIPITNIKKEDNNEDTWIPELKEIFIVFLIGFLIVIILDLYMNRN